jgi:hypothetical protein
MVALRECGGLVGIVGVAAFAGKRSAGMDGPFPIGTIIPLTTSNQGRKDPLVSHHVEGRKSFSTARASRDDRAARFLDRVFDGDADELVQGLPRSERIPPGAGATPCPDRRGAAQATQELKRGRSTR